MTDLSDAHLERLRTLYTTLDRTAEHLDGIEAWYANQLADRIETVLFDEEIEPEAERLVEIMAEADT